MGFWDWLTGRDAAPPPAAVPEVDPAPTEADILASLTGVEQLIGSGTLPAVVRSRAARVTTLVRQTLPRLESLGLGSYDSYSVVATATDYLPEAIGAYLRLTGTASPPASRASPPDNSLGRSSPVSSRCSSR